MQKIYCEKSGKTSNLKNCPHCETSSDKKEIEPSECILSFTLTDNRNNIHKKCFISTLSRFCLYSFSILFPPLGFLLGVIFSNTALPDRNKIAQAAKTISSISVILWILAAAAVGIMIFVS